MATRLREHYTKNVVPALTKEFGYKNIMAVPKLEKVSINIGLGEATQNGKLMDGEQIGSQQGTTLALERTDICADQLNCLGAKRIQGADTARSGRHEKSL